MLSRFLRTEIVLAAIDEGFNAAGNILPGPGDAGERIFGTKGSASGPSRSS